MHLTGEDMQLKREPKLLQQPNPLQPLGVREEIVMGRLGVHGLFGMVVEHVTNASHLFGPTLSLESNLRFEGGEVTERYNGYTGEREVHHQLTYIATKHPQILIPPSYPCVNRNFNLPWSSEKRVLNLLHALKLNAVFH